MYSCLLVLLLASGSLGADLRRPRQQPAEQGGSQGQGGSIPGISNFQPIFQQFQNPNPQEFITNPGNQISQFGNQIPGGSQFTNQIPGGFNPQSFIPGGQQQQQQQQQQPSLDFSNRNPPAQAQEPIPIISYENVQPGDGTYRFSYETGDGIKREETGEQKVVGEPPEAGTIAKGSYSYTDIDGNQIAVSYIADENGFQPSGSHIPTPPPIPKEIMAALEQSAAQEAAQNNGIISPAYHYFFRNFRRY
ncbi:Insect cuticle protein [Nesidiocoris tenuis]|uniref:Insect cuticle protein n=1 Tax=Nesidiocoris tenuis TaxID=355587 RepID=A0ABN7B9G3_9HEMI|nr:Insect cuticle protein [Nesidiocoris tenuis]